MLLHPCLSILYCIFAVIGVSSCGTFYHASVRVNGEHTCGGTIITNHHILTSRLCVTSNDLDDLSVVIGTESLSRGGKSIKVESVVEHEDGDDIAILYINENMRAYRKPIKIAMKDDHLQGPVTLTGWTFQTKREENSKKLLRINKEIYDQSQCAKKYRGIDNRFVCVIDRAATLKCNIDYGSSIVAKGQLVGMKIFGFDCIKGKPEVYLRISYYADWIKQYIED